MTIVSPAPADGSSRRIVIASSERSLYGGELQALLLAEGLVDRGHHVAVLARRDGELACEATARGLVTHPLDVRHTTKALWATRRFLRDFEADILHCNDPRALTTAGGAGLGLGIAIRSVARRVTFPIRSPVVYRRLADRVLCVSEAVRGECLKAGLPPALLHLVRDAVEEERAVGGHGDEVRRDLGLSHDGPLVLCVASLQECKGHRVLLDALPGVWSTHPDAVVALVGDGPLRRELEQQAQQLPGRVVFLGYRTDVADLLAAADLFVLASIQEGLGSSLIEAALAGVPTVATTAGGIPELLGPTTEGAAGWLVAPADASALADALREALSEPEQGRSRAARAAVVARTLHAPERMLTDTLAAWTHAPYLV